MLPQRVVLPLQAHLQTVAALHRSDLAEGFGRANLPFSLARKYPECRGRVGLAICVSVSQSLARSAFHGDISSSLA